MPMYLIQGRYPSEAWQRLMNNPEDREASLRKSVAAFGGKLHAFYFAFGDNDVYALVEAPDNKTMMAGCIVSGAAGASTRTVVLIPPGEAKQAMQQAKELQSQYVAPGKQ